MQDNTKIELVRTNASMCLVATVHEACTTMNTDDVHPGGEKCSYWLNGVGQIFDGSKYLNLRDWRYLGCIGAYQTL